jgi:hypothetical protein
MQAWLTDSDRQYRRLAEECIALIGNHRLAAGGVDLDKVNYLFLESVGIGGDKPMPADHHVDQEALKRALIAAYNDKNGTSVRRVPALFLK